MPSATMKNGPLYPAPLKPTGALEAFTFDDSTPAIGREFPTLNIVDDIFNAPNTDELIRDLGITSKCFAGWRTNK
jgi:hypothetical protein